MEQVNEREGEQQLKCISHSQPYILYCEDCCRPVCTLCFSDSSHRGHSISNLEDATQFLNAKSQSLFNKISEEIKAWNDSIKEIAKIRVQTDQNVSEILDNLHTYIENIKKTLDKLYLQTTLDVLRFLDQRPKLHSYSDVLQIGTIITQVGGGILKKLSHLSVSSLTHGIVNLRSSTFGYAFHIKTAFW